VDGAAQLRLALDVDHPRLARDPEPPSFPRRPLAAILAEKLPLLALSAASSAITVVAQARGGAVTGLGLGARAANALVAYVRYLAKTLWPADLAAFYPFKGSLPSWQVAAAALLLAAITATAIASLRRAPWLP
jgi:hypothetical protein